FCFCFLFSSRRRHTRSKRDWSSDVCSSDLDFIEDQEAVSPSDHAAYELLKEQLEDVLDTLTDREENVLRLRFGLADGRTRTLERSEERRVGREYICMLEQKRWKQKSNEHST